MDTASEDTETAAEEFKCEKCGKVCKNKVGLTAHMRSHKPKKEFVTAKDIDDKLSSFEDRMVRILEGHANINSKKLHTETHVDSSYIDSAPTIPLNKVGETLPIERVSENDFAKAAELEAFMNQMLVVLIHEGQSLESDPVIVPSVNGVPHPIKRGVETLVRRSYVEALARCKDTKYKQLTPDNSRPDKIDMKPFVSGVYPFSVLRDPHPNGPKWLESIRREAA